MFDLVGWGVGHIMDVCKIVTYICPPASLVLARLFVADLCTLFTIIVKRLS